MRERLRTLFAPSTPFPLLGLMIAVYVAAFSFLTVRRHQCFAVGEWDTGIFAQSFWTAAFAGLPFYNTYEGHSHFAYHNSPILLLLLPVYRILPTVETLLVAQTVALALGAVPVFLLARDLVGPRTGLVFAALWLLNFPLHGVNWHDFHETGLGAAPLMLALWGILTGRRGPAWVGAVLAMLHREDMGFVVAGLGLLGGYRRRRSAEAAPGVADPPLLPRADCLGLVAMGGLWTWLSFGVIMPYFRGAAAHMNAERLAHLGTGPAEWLVSPVTRAGAFWGRLLSGPSLSYLLGLLAPLAFLPLLDVATLLVAAPILLLNLESGFGGMRLFTSHYAGPLIPFFFAAAIRGAAILARGRQDSVPELRGGEECALPGSESLDVAGCRLLRPAVVLTVLTMLIFDPSPLHLGRSVPSLDEHSRSLQRVVSSLPRDVSVSAPVHVWTHVADRVEAYPFYHDGVDYVIADEGGEKMQVFMREGGFDRTLPPLLQSGAYVLERSDGPIRVYRRAHPSHLPGDGPARAGRGADAVRSRVEGGRGGGRGLRGRPVPSRRLQGRRRGGSGEESRGCGRGASGSSRPASGGR